MATDKITVAFKPTFVRQFKKLELGLREEVVQEIELFKNRSLHAALKAHKLHGPLAGFYSFSVNYRYRIVFDWEKTGGAVLLAIGDHKVYE